MSEQNGKMTRCNQAPEKMWEELTVRSQHLSKRGRYPEAIEVGKEALKVAEQGDAPDYPVMWWTLCELGNVYQVQAVDFKGQRRLAESHRAFAQAKRLYRRALKICKQVKGRERSEAIYETLGQLACLEANQGNHKKADRIFTAGAEVALTAMGVIKRRKG